ncbi:hypothetical protein OS187_10165 [Xanthomonadaceae bacterium JHOS43]|nr:hypothetical protein [Xanthomonadaceae bacterium JHOS43]
MNIYIDTELTSLADPRLISIGAVTDYERSFYGIVCDFPRSACTGFVREQVLPWLDLYPADANESLGVLALRFCDWLSAVSASSVRSCRLIVDDEADIEMVRQLLRKGGWAPADIEARCVLRPLSVENGTLPAFQHWFDENPARRRHNALDDTRAFRHVTHTPCGPAP